MRTAWTIIKPRTAFLILAAAAPALTATAALKAQSPPPPPPIKMGLWEGTTVTTMTGLTVPPEMAERLKAMGRPVPGSEPRTMQMQSCLTPESWKQMFTRMQDRENCKVTNLKQDAAGMSADMSCQSGGTGSAQGHLQMDFLTPEKMHGTMHIEVTSSRQPKPIVMDITIDSLYQGADCKDVSPDTPKLIMK
jgi:Spy/CpxP family protein refolding chaperone